MKKTKRIAFAGMTAFALTFGGTSIAFAAVPETGDVIAPTRVEVAYVHSEDGAEPNDLVGSYMLDDEEVKSADPDNEAFLFCEAGKPAYAIDYAGILDMTPVVKRWNEYKEEGRRIITNAQPIAGQYYDDIFAKLDVASSPFDIYPNNTEKGFFFSFKVDPNVVNVDESILKDISAWKTLYESINTNNFSRHMIIDEAKEPSYDETTGLLKVPFKLKDGLKAGELDEDYKTLKELVIVTPKGLLTVKPDKFMANNDASKQFLVTNPKVEGYFYVKSGSYPVSLLGFSIDVAPQINRAMLGTGFFPVHFKQDATDNATIKTISTYSLKHAYVSFTAGKTLPKAVMDTLPADFDKLIDLPAEAIAPQTTKVKVADGVWEFEGWNSVVDEGWVYERKDNITDCKNGEVVGTWKFVEKVKSQPVKPVVKPTTPTANPAAPAPKSTTPVLAKTGVSTGSTLFALLAFMIGGSMLALRKRNS